MQSKMISSWFRLFLLGSLCFGVFSAPLDHPSYEEEDPELTGGHFEGDIILDVERNGLLKAERLWPNGIVPYKIAEGFEAPFADYIREAMGKIEQSSCIRFVPAVNETAYLSILVSSAGCSAQIGYANAVRILNLKPVELDKGCFKSAVIQHEMLHSLGFTHQHNSPDRDSYVKILTANIIPGEESAFAKTSAANYGNYGESYDYGSVLHYNAFAFSSNGLPTILALNPLAGMAMGQRVAMSDVDIRRLNRMYNCTTSM